MVTSDMQQTVSWKLNLCYDTKVYYKHTIHVMTNFPWPHKFSRQKNFPEFFIFLTILEFPKFSRKSGNHVNLTSESKLGRLCSLSDRHPLRAVPPPFSLTHTLF